MPVSMDCHPVGSSLDHRPRSFLSYRLLHDYFTQVLKQENRFGWGLAVVSLQHSSALKTV